MICDLKSFLGKSLDDVLIYGIADISADPVEFLPQLDYIFLVVDGVSVRLLREASTDRLSVSVTTEAPLLCILEESHRQCCSRIGGYVLADPNSARNQVERFVLFGLSEETFAAIEIQLASGQVLLFDPLFIDGINFGGVEQKAVWLNNSTHIDATTVE